MSSNYGKPCNICSNCVHPSTTCNIPTWSHFYRNTSMVLHGCRGRTPQPEQVDTNSTTANATVWPDRFVSAVPLSTAGFMLNKGACESLFSAPNVQNELLTQPMERESTARKLESVFEIWCQATQHLRPIQRPELCSELTKETGCHETYDCCCSGRCICKMTREMPRDAAEDPIQQPLLQSRIVAQSESQQGKLCSGSQLCQGSQADRPGSRWGSSLWEMAKILGIHNQAAALFKKDLDVVSIAALPTAAEAASIRENIPAKPTHLDKAQRATTLMAEWHGTADHRAHTAASALQSARSSMPREPVKPCTPRSLTF